MDRLYIFIGGPGSGCEATGGEGGNGCGGEANLLVRAEAAEAANTQLDGIATTLMESNRKLAEALEAEKARADEAEAALAAAVQDMEAMALTIRQRTDHDTDCCPTTPIAAPSVTTTAPRRTTAPAGKGRSVSSGEGSDKRPLLLPQEQGLLRGLLTL